MKTSELTGAALDWAVAACEGKNGVLHDDGITRCIVIAAASGVYKGTYRPATNWLQGGPIIEQERIGVYPSETYGEQWAARTLKIAHTYGPTPLIAAMRCYVASKWGDDIEVPEELL
jgi:hypothetical protein